MASIMGDQSLEPKVRLATRADLEAINRIYNYYVDHSTCTYAERHCTPEERLAWFEAHDPKHPVTVAEVEGNVVGWGSLSAYHERSAYRFTVEDSIYIRHEYLHRGIGSTILKDLIDRARTIGHHVIIAGMDAEQSASLALHEKFGFAPAGHLRQVGFKFGRWLDVYYKQLFLTQ
jgi:L-amino acid N-acyltransferase